MLRTVVAAVLMITAFWPIPSIAAADATHEKCTCDLKDPRLTNGASVRNATACWAHEDVDHEWCDISVEAIEGDSRHQTIISDLVRLQNDPAEMVRYLQGRADSSLDGIGDPPTMQFMEAKARLPEVMKQFDQLTTECVERFLRHRETKEPFETLREGDFTCQIGETTGWLRMSYQVGDVRFVYMVAPDA